MIKKANESSNQNTFLIVGLGNPGPEHKLNRHNIGYMVVDELAKTLGLEFRRMRFDALVEKGNIDEEQIILAKPRTYMNRSGQAAVALLEVFEAGPADLLVVYDDADLELGRARLRPRGGAGGHNGLRSMINELSTDAFNALPRRSWILAPSSTAM